MVGLKSLAKVGLTRSLRDDPEVQRRLRTIQLDNKGVQERKIAERIRALIPQVDKLFNSSTNIPAGLQKLEVEYKRKLYWPRSVYVYKKMWTACQAYLDIADRPYEPSSLDVLSQYSHAWCPSDRHTFDLELDRNKRALTKGSGLPKLGHKKKDELPYALDYVEHIIKPSSSLGEMYSVFPGYRTQQSSPDEPKVRLVWMYPITSWILECEALDSGITRINAKNQSDNIEVKLFYTEPRNLLKWRKNFASRVVTWVNGDASQFDATVRASELSTGWQWFAPNYEFTNLCADYATYSSLVLPEADLVRYGGMPSGSKGTNLLDGWTNFIDWCEALSKTDKLRYLECAIVNGDDITLGMSTVFTSEDLEACAKLMRRKLNVEKTMIEQFIWNSKWYIDDNIITRPIYRALNSIMYTEARSNPLTSSREYVEIALAMQLRDIETHPLGPEIIKLIAGITKYHISTMSKEQLRLAAQEYLAEHSWMVESGQFGDPDKFVEWLLSSEYAQTEV